MKNNARNAYVGASVGTASPERLLVMLCERLVLDLQRGREAQLAGRREDANTQLLHAQDIVLELRSSLNHDAWAGAARLDALYGWMHAQLITANTRADVKITEHVLSLAMQLADTWRQAAMATQKPAV